MAATTSLFIDKYHPKQGGKCAISIRVTFERKKKYYQTGISLTEAEFVKVQSERPKKEFKEIALQLQAYEMKAANIIKNMPAFTFNSFEKQYHTNRGTKDSIDSAFTNYANELREADRIGTAVSYECAKASLNKFSAGLKFADVTPELLNKYEKWMLQNGNSITTVGIYLRSLRCLFNNAIADGVLTNEYYPFGKRRYEIPTGNNVKKALTLKDIAKIFNYRPEAGTIKERTKDYWIFMYLCNGINVKDMSLLKYENVKGDILEFTRAKTARTKRNVEPIRAAITTKLRVIIEKWGNESKESNNYIFPILTKGLSIERQRDRIQLITHLINEHMKTIAKSLEIANDVTTYTARHSFATILQRSGVSTEFISEALGHSNIKTTQNYLAGFEDDSKREMVKALTAFEII
jgi:integrase/recombinase XerD